ncbi:MAG: 3-deoxy-7-phosphoheptulonate synthase [Nitrospina sp.]|jgi:3-deoxy-7-phosphoheptulonate synthase|nr:3-deoxy-7-phosphoheptulonate synthase [Nitrospina sp.]MBT3413546.1 3-deoxy-7-phosphoheptulonate synthase [Nitrospina sp.]MBT3855511.1 3-deoxy-7-phosphoheptulonate synthase [Nitrospina sp.]MBT4104903.1 3-deoxy-7-phosphoheptulonate synthase [Nitrospina sp.]MBT4388640.1 3-deoxy-7-phosphoheptulonate synthase [Nitrospina sp.]
MIIVMSSDATPEEIKKVEDTIHELGYTPHAIVGVERKVIGAVGDERGKDRLQSIETMSGVESVFPILKPYKLASREVKSTDSVIQVGGVAIGGPAIAIIAGPCSVESKEQICTTANLVKSSGANFLRGGAYKPRTSPYSFQGMEEDGLKLLAAAKEVSGLPIVTEVMNPREIDLVAQYADVIQVGARNMQNFSLLKELGKIDKPILLKRGMMNTIKEFLMSAEYILAEGNNQLILCERGIRTFETATRNTLDISCIPVLKKETHLPIIVDPSHATGHWEMVESMSRASIAAGADGLIIEVHPDPVKAFSDGPQSLKPEKFARLMENLRPFAELMGRTLR